MIPQFRKALWLSFQKTVSDLCSQTKTDNSRNIFGSATALTFLATTAQHLKSNYVKDPWTAVAFPKHALKHPNWPIVNLVCTRLLPCVYSPKFKKAYEASKPALTKSGEFYSTNLESFTRFVRDDPNYTQSHSAAQDVLDLADFVKSMVAHDGPSVFNYGDQYVNWDPIGSFTPRPQDDEKVLRFLRFTTNYAANMLALTPTACLRGSQMSFETYRAMYCNREPWNMRTVQALKGSPWNLCWW